MDKYNAGAANLNGTLAKMRSLVKKDSAAAGTNSQRTNRCLLAIDDWIPATVLLEPALVAGPEHGDGRAARHVRSADGPQADEVDELGYVERGMTTMHLAPVTCLGLERVIEHPDSLDCASTSSRRFVSCPPGIAEAVTAIVTLAHEEQHIDGVENEAVAQCNAYQKADQAATALGVPADVAKRLALFTYRSMSQPKKYHSKRCHSGGALDLQASAAAPGPTSSPEPHRPSASSLGDEPPGRCAVDRRRCARRRSCSPSRVRDGCQ